MERALDSRIAQAIDAWLAWVPSWRPATHRGRTRVCQRCFGSPLIAAAGLDNDVPHAVQHGLATRLTGIIEDEVDAFTAMTLPNLERELREAERRKAHRYRPDRGLAPELSGAPLDPEPMPGEPFLFTFAGLAEDDRVPEPEQPSLSEEQKAALREEIGLADRHARAVGLRACQALLSERPRIREAIALHIEPQVSALLSTLDGELDTPPSAW